MSADLQTDPDTPETIRAVTDIIARNGVLGAGRLELVRAGVNLARSDYRSRVQLLAVIEGVPRGFVILAPDLHSFWKRACGFYAAFPLIGCRPLLFEQLAATHLVVLEYFPGRPFREALAAGELDGRTAMKLLEDTWAQLQAVRQSSDLTSMRAELEELIAEISRSSLPSGLDRMFLEAWVFPFLRAEISKTSVSRRWTNGDFFAGNLLVDKRGQVRIIDYEFARETHFWADDAWRWVMFSELPEEFAHPKCFGGVEDDPVVVVLGALRQLLLAQSVHGASVVASDWPGLAQKIVGAVAGHFASPGRGVFPPLLFSHVERQNQRRLICQLFWRSTDQEYSEVSSIRREIPPDRSVAVEFGLLNLPAAAYLRIDPVDAPGVLFLDAIEVFCRSGQCWAKYCDSAGWDGVSIAQEAIEVSRKRGLVLIAAGSDPALQLAEIVQPQDDPVVSLVVHLRYSGDLSKALPHVDPLQIPQLRAEHGPCVCRELSLAQSAAESADALLSRQAMALAELQRRLEERDREGSVREAEVESLRKELNSVRSELQETVRTRDNARKQVEDFEQQLTKLEIALTETRRLLSELEAQQRSREEQSRSMAEELRKISFERDDARKTADRRERDLRTVEEENVALESKLKTVIESLYSQQQALLDMEYRAKCSGEDYARLIQRVGLMEGKLRSFPHRIVTRIGMALRGEKSSDLDIRK